MWLYRVDYGCKGKDGKCIWIYNCGLISIDCKIWKVRDLNIVKMI